VLTGLDRRDPRKLIRTSRGRFEAERWKFGRTLLPASTSERCRPVAGHGGTCDFRFEDPNKPAGSVRSQPGPRLFLHDEEIAEPIEQDSLRILPPPPDFESTADDAVPLDGRAPRALMSREALRRRLLGAADVLAVAITLSLVLNVTTEKRTALLVLAIPVVLVPFKVAGLYDHDELHLVQSTLDEAPTLLQLTAMFTVGVVILKWLLVHGTLTGEQGAEVWLGSCGAVVAARVAVRWLSGRILPPERCLVIGEPERARRIRERLASSPAKATVVASLPLNGADIEDIERSDSLRHLILELITKLDVHRLVVAPPDTDAADVVGLIRVAKTVGVHVSVLPRMFEVVGSAVEFDDVDGMTMLGIRRFGLSQSSRLLKRSFDLVATSFGLLLVAPLMVAIAVAIRLESPGPSLFRQVRVGRDGRRFWILKFRSMVVDAESQKDQLRIHNEAGAGLFKIGDDPRITRIGNLLRRASLDELPQLLNVLRGDMSLVGPRPLVVDEDAQVNGLDRSRLHLTPGMTGPWQVLGTRVPMEEMVGIDYLYVSSWSLWLDVKILLRTIRHVAHRSNL
jgi:exopolysaccharide biosynthesis polyprenyl glycosylphosphotransferase